jgi:hypothetical protein
MDHIWQDTPRPDRHEFYVIQTYQLTRVSHTMTAIGVVKRGPPVGAEQVEEA